MDFSDRLVELVRKKQSAVCVGLDPRWQQLPESMRRSVDVDDRSAVASAIECFCREVIDAVAEYAPIVKPQSAFFELLGPAGLQTLWQVIRYARQAGLLVLLDGKRGDIGSTAQAYAEAYLGGASPWQCDALTVNPFLGDDTLQPFAAAARERDAGVFVLVKTSNPGSGFLQDRSTTDGPSIYSRVAALVESLAADRLGQHGYGSVGAVVGATYPQQLAELRRQMPSAWLLIPGYGAQGGGPDDVVHGFDSRGLGAIVNSSRGIIFAYESAAYKHLDWQHAVASAAREMAAGLPHAQ